MIQRQNLHPKRVVETGMNETLQKGVSIEQPEGHLETSHKHGATAALRRWCRVLTVILIGAVVLGHFGLHHRFLDLLSHFQVQYLCGSAMLGLLLVTLRSWRWALVCLLLVIMTGVRVAPWYGAGDATGAGQKPNLRLMLFNILQTNDRYEEAVNHVLQVDPDVVILQEVNQAWLEQVQELARTRPYTQYIRGGVLRGTAIFSRFPLTDGRIEAFGDDLTPGYSATLEVEGTKIYFTVCHPWPPANVDGYRARNRQLEFVGKAVARQLGPRILIGDLNVTMWSPHYQLLEERTGLRNARKGFGVLASFPMDELFLARVPIDHCLVSDEIRVVDCRLGEPGGSDHAPLIVDLVIPAVK